MSSAKGYPLWRSALLNAFWIPLNFQDTALITIAVPAAVLQLRPADHVRVFAALAAMVSFVAMFVPPIAGAISDRFRERGVPRRAFILGGAALDVACLVMMARVHSLPAFAVFLLLATFGANVSLAAYQALLPDIVPKTAWGAVSGARSIAMVIGTALGIGVAAGTPPASAFIGVACAAGLGALTLLFVHETRAQTHEEKAHVKDWHDFIVVFIARMFLAFGLAMLMTFVLYFFKDVLHADNPSAGTGIVAGASLVGAIVSAAYLGWLSDRFPRKYLVALCGIPMVLAAAGFGAVPQQRWMFGFAFLFGVGFGGVLSTGWALAIDSVPRLRDVARDLGIWGIATNLPSVIAPLVGGWILGLYGGSLTGYRLLFFSAAFSFLLASAVVLDVGSRPFIPLWAVVPRILSAWVVAAYTHTAYRIRRWGKLPVPRGRALVVSNHQNELDLMPAFANFILGGGWRTPVLSASAKVLFEPGFLAVRIPWLWRPLHNLNMGPLFAGMGLLPLENELQTRSIARWSWAVARRHGVVPLEDIFKKETVERLALQGLTTASFASARYFRFGQDTLVRLSEINVAYRRELFDETKAGIEEDLRRMEDAARAGATNYITPEGEYSRDGHMLPFRGLWDRLAPLADQIFIDAISYDPFVGRRFSQLSVIREARKETVVEELAAARPVTVSALLASWLQERDRPFSAGEAIQAVEGRLRDLPSDLFVDPELERDPQRRVRQALKRMCDLQLLRNDAGTFSLTGLRTHKHYPDVADIIAFQATFLSETIANAQKLQAQRLAPERTPAAS